MKFRNAFIETVSILYICLFLYTGIAKLMDYDLSREQMAMMPLAGPIAGVVTWLLPISEILLGIIIFIPKTRLLGLYSATGLMLVFTVYVAYLMKYYSNLPCTCGGFIQDLSWEQHLILNAVFVILGMIGVIILKNKSYNKVFSYTH